MAEKDRAAIVLPDNFMRLVVAVETIANRANIGTIVEPRALDENAVKIAQRYAATAASLRTIFEPTGNSSAARPTGSSQEI